MDSYRFHIRKGKKDETLIMAYNYELDHRVEGEDKQKIVKAIKDKLGDGRCYIRRKKIVYSKRVISKK